MNWSEYRDKILHSMDYEAFYLNELENIQRRGTELKAACPFTDRHESGIDVNPSLTVNLDKGVFYCQTCHVKGNVHKFLMMTYNKTNEEAWFIMGDSLELERPNTSTPDRPAINQAIAAEWHMNLMKLSGPLREVLRQRRGLKDETLQQFQIGWDPRLKRIAIPIYDDFGELGNFRLYKWNAESSADKMKNFADEITGNNYGELRVYGIENLTNPDIAEIIWCEGELDRIILEQNGFPTSTPTSGAGSFKDEWLRLFKTKKRVYILMDNDEAGRNATKSLAEKMSKVTEVYVPKWPDNFVDKGDATDFFTNYNGSVEAFQKILDEAVPFKLRTVDAKLGDIVDVHLAEASDHQQMGVRQRIQIMCSGKDTAPYIAPKKVKITCSPTSDPKCNFCENASFGGEQILEFNASQQDTISLIQCTTTQQMSIIKQAAKMNEKCKSNKIEVLEYMNIEELRAIPQADVEFEFVKEHEYVVRKCYFIGNNIKTNQRYSMVGYAHAEPKTQYVTHIFDEAVPSKDRISAFEMNEEMHKALSVFQPTGKQTVQDKFEEIHRDLERNVTFVWERRKVGMVVDLVYHTALSFYFQEQFVRRGWGEALIIGDSGQAKSTLVERLMRHYQLGELYSGESSRRTGLVYSFQQTQKRWFLIWGAWPLNDGGLIVIDEFGGISEDELANMSDVRSSGIARATGVITAETNARTRGIFMANPRNGRQLDTETHGVQAVLKLFGKAEDVRRLDIVIAVASGDVHDELINRPIEEVPKVHHSYTSELCKLRALWCWSRKPEDIIFSPDANRTILEAATAMGRKYSSRIPIVEPADQRLKLARLSIAAAGATYSTNDGYKLLVEKKHVDFVVWLLNDIYDDKNLGYGAFSEIANRDLVVSESQLIMLRKKFCLLPVHSINELAQTIYDIQYFRRSELQDSTGLNNEDLLKVMSFLNVNKVIERTMSGYRKLPNGIKFLKTILDKPITDKEIKDLRSQTYKEAEF